LGLSVLWQNRQCAPPRVVTRGLGLRQGTSLQTFKSLIFAQECDLGVKIFLI